tara:strand:+ start:104 stop:481 length:378 start_codon:yes stop_codon:yes gene_type:complete
MPNITGTAAAGFQDASLWEESKKKGRRDIESMIDKGLENTSVTVVLITQGAANREYINYEIDQSLARGNGLVAVQIHHLNDPNVAGNSPGDIPSQIESNGFKAYKYTNKEALARWIEEAAKIAEK